MRYVLVMLGSLVGLVIVAYLLLYILISVGCIYPANYAEQNVKSKPGHAAQAHGQDGIPLELP